jgi:hypothetical protein
VACKAAVASLEYDKEQLRLRLRAADRTSNSAAGADDGGSPQPASQSPGFADKFKRSMGQASRSVGGLFTKQSSKPKRSIEDLMAPTHDDVLASPQQGRRRPQQGSADASPARVFSSGDAGASSGCAAEVAGPSRVSSVLSQGVAVTTATTTPTTTTSSALTTPRKSGGGSLVELGKSRKLVREVETEAWGLDVDSSVDTEGVWVHLVIDVQRGSPASRSGVSAGDAIIVVDGHDALSSDHAELVSLFQEPRKDIVIKVCPCDDLLSTLQQPQLTLL